MKEKLNSHHEQGSTRETYNLEPEHIRPQVEHRKTTEVHKHDKRESIEDLKHDALEKAKSSSEIMKNHDSTPNTGHAIPYVRHTSATNTLKQARKSLRPTERQFSKLIHNPAVETASDIAGGTIARPSGLLWGGIFSMIASIAIMIVCRYYGYEYNYMIGLASFVGGFFIGIFVEATLKGFRRKTR